MFAYTRFCYVCACLFLVACASRQVIPASPETYTQHLQSLAPIQAFSLKGRLAVNSQGKGFSGGIAWDHQTQADVIDIFTPLGNKVANIQKSLLAVVLTTQDGRTIEADSTETLTEKAIGIRLPLEGLNDWALGRPTKAHIDAIIWDEFGRISKLHQQGWEINYPVYSQLHTPALPSKITLRNEQLQLRLVIETWHTNLP